MQKEEVTMARGGAWAVAAAAVLWWMAAGAGAVWLEIAPSGTKCVAEEIRSNVVVIGDYSVLYEHQQAHPTVSVKVIHLRTFIYILRPNDRCINAMWEVIKWKDLTFNTAK